MQDCFEARPLKRGNAGGPGVHLQSSTGWLGWRAFAPARMLLREGLIT